MLGATLNHERTEPVPRAFLIGRTKAEQSQRKKRAAYPEIDRPMSYKWQFTAESRQLILSQLASLHQHLCAHTFWWFRCSDDLVGPV